MGFDMQSPSESIAAVNKASWDVGVKLATVGSEALGKVIRLQTSTALGLYSEMSGNAKLLGTQKGAEQALQVLSKWPQLVFEKSLAYGRDLSDVALWSQSVAARILDDAYGDLHRSALETVEKNVLHATAYPGGWLPQSAINAVTNWLDTTNAGIKQIASVGETGATQTNDASADRVKRVPKAKRRKRRV